MTYLIYALVALAVFHFIYEAILAPSLRLALRFKLFELRDEVRALKINFHGSLEDHHFDYLHSSINTLISMLYRFDSATLAQIEAETRRNPELKKRAAERARLLDDCKMPQALDIRKRSLVIAAVALVVNSGAWGIYVIPIAMVFVCLSFIKSRIKIIVSLTDKDLNKFSPADSLAVSPS